MSKNVKQSIDEAAEKLAANYAKQEIFEIAIGERIPRRAAIIEVLLELRRLMFPGYFGSENMAYVSFKNFAGNALAVVYEKMFKQVYIALSYKESKTNLKEIEDRTERLVLGFLNKLPEIQTQLLKDVEAELMGDPAAKSKEEIIFSYPGIFAIYVYRVAHELYNMGIPFIPRIMSEYAHGDTGIDINPGAQIGDYFFIDHGTGIVIGETTIIGSNVKLYQGVTLGALSTRKGQDLTGVKRHPTIEDNVVIYANATILGGDTVIGKNSVIAGNSFITGSIPANTKVSTNLPELNYKTQKQP
ncbi:MAG: serine O-acetyltransferase EpsC [Oscillospiraceae bacterium]